MMRAVDRMTDHIVAVLYFRSVCLTVKMWSSSSAARARSTNSRVVVSRPSALASIGLCVAVTTVVPTMVDDVDQKAMDVVGP